MDEKALEAAARAVLHRRIKPDFFEVKDGAWILDHDKVVAEAAVSAYLDAMTAPAAMPGEEEIARAIYESRNGRGCVPWSRRDAAHKAPYLSDARAILALFAPILAEKERLEREWASEKERADMAVRQMIRQNDRIRELALLLDKQMGTPCEQIRHQQEADELRAQIEHLTEKTRLPVIADYIEVQNHSRAMESRALAAEAALAAERERCERAIRDCPSLDANGYICEKAAAIKSIRAQGEG